VFLIVGSYVPALYYGFACMPEQLMVYLSGVTLYPSKRYIFVVANDLPSRSACSASGV
jgi:predicted membrane channel-forming protein YqfA (hemolysin III family)